MTDTESDLLQIKEHYIKKNDMLNEIFDLSLKISDLISVNETDADMDFKINDIIERREQIIECIKNIDVTVKHYMSALPAGMSNEYICVRNAVNNGEKSAESFSNWGKLLFSLLSAQKIVLDNIKTADEKNNAGLAVILNELKIKIKDISNNRKLMDNYMIPDTIPAGTLFNKKN